MAGYAVNGITRGVPVQSLRPVLSIFFIFFLVACGTPSAATQTSSQPFTLPISTGQPEIIQTITEIPTFSQTISCNDWQSWPVIPFVSNKARELYQWGEADGNNPRAFSKIGDGE